MTDQRLLFRLILMGIIGQTLLTSARAAPLRIVLDPGHGGKDAGAVHEQLREKDIALKVSLLTEKLLLEQAADFSVALTRREDIHLPLADRVQIAKDQKADILISVHVNASQDPSAHGSEIYFQNQLPPKEEEIFLANRENQALQGTKQLHSDSDWFNNPQLHPEVASILDDVERSRRIERSYELAQGLSLSWRSRSVARLRYVRQAPFFLVTKSLMPTALLELGFLSHPPEAKRLGSAEFQQSLAENILLGIKKYKEILDKPAGPE